ncbi:alpha-amylase family glycosyl hydrolase, partial [Actinotignum timonense]
RLDVAYAVPTDFWAEVLGKVRERFPEALFLGEVIHGDYPDFVARSSVDTLTQYELWASIRQSIAARNFWELDWNLGRHAQFCEHFIPNTFIGNHDVERIATAVGPAGAVLAAAVLFTVPGMPSIYYGDEQGFTGTKLEGFSADDQLRPPLPERPEQLSDLGAGMYRAYRALIALRRTHPWLTRARLEVTGKDNTWIEYRVWERQHDDAAPASADSGQPAELRVRLELEPHPSARVIGVDPARSDVELFSWHAGAESGE